MRRNINSFLFAVLFLCGAVSAVPAQAGSKSRGVYRTIAGDLLKSCKGKGKAVAIAGFSYLDGRDSGDGAVVSERLTTELVKIGSHKVVERREIDKVFSELKLQGSGAMDPEAAKKIGKLLSVDLIIVGTLTEVPGGSLEINARVVGAGSGEILGAVASRVKKDWLGKYKAFIREENEKEKERAGSAEAFYKKGVAYSDLGEFDNAIGSFGLALSLDPSRRETYFARGMAYIEKFKADRDEEHLAKARADLSRAIELDPEYLPAYLNRGLVYAAGEESGPAIEDFSRVVALSPRSGAGYSYRGQVYGEKKEYQKAIADLSKAISLEPGIASYYFGRAAAYDGKKEYDKAIADLSKAIDIDPGNGGYYLNRGNVYSEMSSWDKAIADFSTAIGLEPGAVYGYVNRVHAYEKKGMYGKAVEDYTSIIAIDPENSDMYYFDRAAAYEELGEDEKAAADIKKAEELRSGE